MGVTSTNQCGFRGRTDDSVGLNVDSGWSAAQNTDFSWDVDVVRRIRFEVEEVNNKIKNQTGTLEYNLLGAGWNPVTSSSSVLRAVASGQFADGDATSNVLTASAKTFVAGAGDEDGVVANVALQNTH